MRARKPSDATPGRPSTLPALALFAALALLAALAGGFLLGCQGMDPGSPEGERIRVASLLPFLETQGSPWFRIRALGDTETGGPSEKSAPEPGLLERLLDGPAPDSTTVATALEALDEGLELWRDDRHREGAVMVDLALDRLPALADWRPLIEAELLAAAGDTTGVRSALARVEPETGFHPRWGWSFLVQSYEEADDQVGAWFVARSEAARSQADDWPSELSAAVWLRAGRLGLEVGDTAAAGEDLRRALSVGGSGSASGRSAARILAELVEPADLAERLAVGRALLEGGSWDRGYRLISPVLDSDVLDERTEAELRIWTGRALVETARAAEAAAVLQPLRGAAVPSEFAEPALYWSGRAALGRNRPEEARETFLELGRRFPTSLLAEEGLLLLLDDVTHRSGATAGARVMEALLEVGVGSAAGELATIRFGTEKFLAGEFERAATTFEQYLEGSRRTPTRQQAGYWAALSHERRGEADRARQLLRQVHTEDPLSFYGTFAGDRLDAPVLPRGLGSGPAPVADPVVHNRIANALIRLQVHQRVPTAGSFNHEMARLEEHFLERPSTAYDLAEALLDGGLPIQGVVLGRTLHRREGHWNLRLLRIVYPFPYREHIVRESRARGLDPFFVAGLIRQESLFHPTIRSGAGAVGLMQLLPSTAREVARAEGIRFSTASLDDPAVNVRLGTAYLASMVRRFDGRAEDALSAYNAGPGRIQQWRGRPEYRDTQVFLERIPFRETRNYVKVVQQNTRIYTALYGCGDFEPCTGLSYRAAVARSTVAGGAPSSSLAR